VFDIVAAHDHQLPLSIDLERVHDAKPLLAAAAARQLDSAAEHQPEEHEHQCHAD
jgi:hypothetical protein